MSQSMIPLEHITHFMHMCISLKEHSQLDVDNIAAAFTSEVCSQYPQKEQSAAFPAVTVQGLHLHGDYVPMVMIASPPHYHETEEPYIELCLAAFHEEGVDMPVAWSVFPDNRQVLTISGLVLDTKNGISHYEKYSLYEDRHKFNDVSQKLIGDMINKFPKEPGSIEEQRAFDATADLARSV